MINISNNAAALQIPESVYVRILKKGIEQTQQDLNDLSDALKEGNHIKIKEIAHKLKGDYLNLHIDEISQAAKKLEDIAKTSRELTEANEVFADLTSCFLSLSQFVSRLESTT